MSLLQRILDWFRPSGEPATDNHRPDARGIDQRGWRQWSCVGSADLPLILKDAWSRLPRDTAMCDRLLIVTQSCDLVHGSFEHEPAVEAYLCELLSSGDKPDGNLTAGKNPRTLMVPFSIDGDARWFRICSNGRMLFPRHLLASLDPDDAIEISDDAVAILKRWLVNRVIRTAFPDAFNDRTAKARQRLEKLLKKGGEPLLGLYINLTPWEELSENQGYLVDLIGLVAEDLDFDQRKAIEKLVGQIAVAYENTDGIDSCDFEVLGEEDFPIRRLRTHRLFPLDFMSLRDKPGGEFPPVG